jgi:hypothetical protein
MCQRSFTYIRVSSVFALQCNVGCGVRWHDACLRRRGSICGELVTDSVAEDTSDIVLAHAFRRWRLSQSFCGYSASESCLLPIRAFP